MNGRPLSTARWAIALFLTVFTLLHPPPVSSQPPLAATDLVAFVDGFDGGSTAKWALQPGWSAAQEGDNGYLHATAAGQATLVQPLTRSQHRLRADVRLIDGSAALWYRRSFDGVHGYRLHVASDGLSLYRWLGEGDVTLLLTDPAPIPAGTWHTLQISGTLGHQQVWVDDSLRIDLDDAEPWYAGSIALEAVGSSPVVDFDGVEIWVPATDELPWEQAGGPDGGHFGTIELDPADPQILYAGGNGGGVFKSTDGGTSWAMLPAFTAPGNAIADLLLSPSDSQTLHARLANGEFLTSADAGSSWRRANQPGLFTCCVAMYRPAPSALLAAGGPNVYHSSNGGRDWADVTGDLPAASQIASLAITGGAEFWVGTTGDTGGAVYHSADGGVHWQLVSTIGQDATLNAGHMFVPLQAPTVLYVGFGESYATPSTAVLERLFVTTDGGTVWTPIPLPMSSGSPGIIGQSPSDGTLFLSLHSALWLSANGGQDWTPLTIPYWYVDPYDIAIHPASSQLLYLPRRSTGLLKSTDGGATWTEIRQGLRNTAVIHLAVPPQPGSSLLYSDGHVSADRGDTWSYFIDNGIDHPFIDDIVVHPLNPDAVWLAVDNGTTFTTTNRGATWTKAISVTGGSGFRFGSIYAAAGAPSDSDRLYVLRNGLGILSSSDVGHSWDNLKTSGVDYTYSLAVHPTDADILYSGYTPKPFQDWAFVRKTVDAGLTWTTAISVAHSTGFTSVAIDPHAPNTVYAGSTGGEGAGGQIYVTHDDGETWGELNEHLTMLTVWGQPQLLVDAANPATVYAATWLGGTWMSRDAGLTWERLKGAPVSSTALSQGGAALYAADRTRPVLWKSTDGGATWAEAADFAAAGAFLLNRVLADGNVVYASTFGPGLHGGRLYRSPDAGASWVDITGTLPRSVLDIALDPADPQIVYVTTHIHGAFKSVDGGATWTEMSEFPHIGGYDIEVDPVTPNLLYAAGMGATTVPDWVMPPAGYTLTAPSGVFKSVDGGLHWEQILTTTNECRAIRLHPDNHDWLFAAALDGGLYVSTDGGDSWTQYNAGLDTLNLTSVAVRGEVVYAGTQGMGVYAGDVNLSTGAVTWQAARSNKPVPAVYSLYIVVDPTDSNRIYVGANPGGLFRSDDGGDTWYDKNFLTPSVLPDDPRRQGYYTFALNPQDANEVWLGTWGKGVFKSFDGMDFDIGANGQDQVMLGKHVNAVLVDPHYGALVATEEGVWRTMDGGDEWFDFSAGLGTPQVRTLNVNVHGRLFAGTAGYEMYTRAPGDTAWTQLPDLNNWGDLWPIWDNRPNYQYTSFLLDAADPDTIYAGTFPAGVWKSTDGGRTWLERNVGFTFDGIFYLVAHPDNPDLIYAGTYNGVNYTQDGGAHWEKRDTGWPGEQWVFSIAFDPRTPRVMVACSKNGEIMGRGRPGFHGTVMKTTDGGARWFAITNGLNVNQEFYEIIADVHRPDTYYLATQYEGVFVTRDGGALWLPWNEGLANESAATNTNNVTSPMVLSADGRYLYFGSAGSGAFRKQIVTGAAIYLPVVLHAFPF